MKQFLRTTLMLALPFIAASCNTDYNFDNISLEVTVGDTEGITVPIGSTGEITLESLLGESGIETDENGNYGFSFEDSMSYNFEIGNIAPISGLAPTISPVTASLIGDINSSAPTFEATKQLSLPSGVTAEMEIPSDFPLLGEEFHMHYDPHTFEGEFEMDIPTEITSIKTIRFGANGEGSILDIQFNLGGMADVSDRRTIEQLNIELTAGFTIDKVAGEAVNDYTTIYAGEGSTTPNHFHIENFEMTGDNLTIDILIKSVDLSNVTINSDGKLFIDEDITFDLDFTGTFKAGKVTSVAPEVNVKADLALYDATFTTGNISHSIDIAESISNSISVPAEIQRIDNINVVDDATGQVAEVVIMLNVENSPVNQIDLKDVEITLPDELIIAIHNGWSNIGGKLCNPLISIDTTSGEIEIARFSIYGTRNLDITNGVINLDGEIGFKGTMAIPEGQEVTLGLHHEDITITPSIKIPDLRIESIEGIIEPDFGNLLEPIEVEIGDFSSSLEGLEMELNINAPVLCVEIQNPIGVGIDAVINIDAYKGGQIAKSIQTPTLVIKLEATTTLAIVSQISSTPEGADGYIVEGFADIINLLPDKLVITLNAETNKQRAHNITLQDNYTFGIAYWVDAPISFSHSTNGHIAYTTTIEDIDLSSLADIDMDVESVVLNIASESTLPIELSLSLEMLDAEGNPIESITATTKGSIWGTAKGSEEVATSKCSLDLAIDAPEGSSSFGELAKTKGLRCRLDGTTIGGGALNSNQYIDLAFSLLLPEGITIDLGSLGGEEVSDTEE